MRLIFFLCAILLLVNKIQCTLEGDCYVEGVKDIHWLTVYRNDPVDDFQEKEFKRFLTENVESVEVVGDDYAKYFSTKIENNDLLILPTHDFPNFEINEKSTNDPAMHVLLKFQCKTGNRQLRFYQPIRDRNSYAPEFDQRSYYYNLPMPLPAAFDISAFGDKIVVCDMDISNVRLHFENFAAEDFFISSSGPINDTNKCHGAIITTINPLRLTSDKVYELVVTDTGIPPRNKTATLIVEVNEKNSLPLNPQFEYAYYIGSYHYSQDQNHSIHIDKPIHLKPGCSNVKLDILEYKNNFRVGCASNNAYVELIRNLASDVLANNRVVAVTIQATMAPVENPSRTVLEVYIQRESSETMGNCTTLPSVECPPCLTDSRECSSPTDCTSFYRDLIHSRCTTTPAPDVATQPLINFLKDNYRFKARLHYEGYIGAVKAIIIPEEDVEYFVVAMSNDSDVVECDQKTGVLKLTKTLSVGTYGFTVFAEGVKTKVKTEASVELNIIVHDYVVESIHSMLVEHVTEEVVLTEIPLPCPYTYCTYSILEQYPDMNSHLSIGYTGYLCIGRIDRESIDVPQFRVALTVSSNGEPIGVQELSNDPHMLSKRSTNWEEVSREWVFVSPETIHMTNRLLVLIIVDDINDNSPIFEVGRKLVVGYPHIKVLDTTLLTPPYLVKVSATDLDVGENATIRYSTESTHFIINPNTGVIYPNKQVFDNESSLSFIVTATDKSGAKDGLSTDLEIEVKLLMEEHIAVIIVENITVEDVDLFVEKLSQNTNLTVKYLTATVIPVCRCKTSSTKRENNSLSYSTRILIYALNEENEPVKAYNLQETLQDLKLPEDFIQYKWNLRTSLINDDYNSIDEGNPDKSDCIVINAILVFLLVCFMVAVAVFGYSKAYKNK